MVKKYNLLKTDLCVKSSYLVSRRLLFHINHTFSQVTSTNIAKHHLPLTKQERAESHLQEDTHTNVFIASRFFSSRANIKNIS
ncbi:hypothetical protein JTE90_017641 [Oedothorax gibbosus]|uniref:Uncharacterized protein n=1 Tax=Oedothorax gibbosus TaxID=931172 RepID=A0AAV6U7N4_9ARAC|nr:hypothetical protein JTE90_017641 [Oedothorax gibbosus]